MAEPIRVPLGALKLVPVEELTAVESDTTPVTKPHPEARIGPDTGSVLSPSSPDETITPHDLWYAPGESFAKMGRLLARDLMNPRVGIPLAVGVAAGALGLGPRSFAATRDLPQGPAPIPAPTPSAATAPKSPSMLQAVGQAVKQNPDAAIDVLPLGRTVKGAARLAQAAHRIYTQTGTESVPEAAPVSSPKVGPKTSASTPIMDATDELAAVAKEPLSRAEMADAAKLEKAGMSPKQIVEQIILSRRLTQLTGTTTPQQAATEIEYMRTHGGRRQQ